MAAQKSLPAYSEPWANEVRTTLLALAQQEGYDDIANSIAVLDAFIAETPSLVARYRNDHDKQLSIDAGGAYPRLCLDGAVAYAWWRASPHTNVSVTRPVPCDTTLSLQFSPAVAIRILGKGISSIIPEDALYEAFRWSDFDLRFGGALYYMTHFDLYLDWLQPGHQYTRLQESGALAEVTLESVLTVAPLQR